MRPTTHRAGIAVSALALLALAAASPARGAGCLPGFTDAGGGWCSADFIYTGAPETVTLPAGGWYAIEIDARGAQGGNSREDGIGEASKGGLGGREVATVVRPGGTTLTLIVGQVGSTQQTGLPIIGGYGGGGQPPSVYGGGGGGGSYVFDDVGPLVIAGGGGGGGWDANPTWSGGIFSANQQAPGGAGAGATGPAGDGQSVAFCCDPTIGVPHFPPGGGVGATASGPGAGGVPGTPPGYIFGQMPGQPGTGPVTGAPLATLAVGGDGGGTSGGSGCFGTWSAGGGGGYFGGGGGGDIPCDLEGGGGGGGIGFADPHATGTTSQTGVQLADGAITLRYSTTTAPLYPIVTSNPVDQTVDEGTPFSFSAAASGTPAPSVQWQASTDGGVTFGDVPGATSATYGATASVADNGSLYHAVFTNGSGSATTTAALLTVNPVAAVAPQITLQPADETVAVGTAYAFTAGASGSPAPTVQWQLSIDGGVTFSDIAGASSTTFGATAAAIDDGNLYHAVFSNGAGTATTSAALLTVTSSTSVALTSSLPTPTYGQTIAFTALVTSPVTGTPKAKGGHVDLLDGPTLLASKPVGGGKAVFRVKLLGAAAHAMHATFSGSGAVQAAISNVLGLTVWPSGTTVKLTGPTRVAAGAAPTFRATVKAVKPGAGAATGSIALFDGATPIAVGAITRGGRATIPVAALAAGMHTLTAQYNGDGNYLGSSSPPLTVNGQ